MIAKPRALPTLRRHVTRVRSALEAIDDLGDTLTKVDAMKMDIEGAEGLALKGMTNVVERSQYLKIMMESCQAMLARYARDVHSSSSSFGRGVHVLDDRARWRPGASALGKITREPGSDTERHGFTIRAALSR